MRPQRDVRLAGVVVAITALGLAAGCNADIDSGIESANDLLYRKQYVAAERLYHKLFKRLGEERELDEDEDAQRLLILDRLGKVNALYLHDYAQAIHFYERLVGLYPKTEQAFAARAMVADIHHHKLGNLEAAVSEYQKLVAEFPGRSETRWAQLQIAGAFFQLRDYDQARTEAEALLNRWPGTAEAAQARFQIANSYYVQGRYAEAIATYERLLEGEPDPSLASLVLFELGNCFQELSDPDRALAYYYACLSDHPNPLLVQRKIRRVRARIHRIQPAESIALPAYVQKRLAIAQGGARTSSGNAEPAPPARNAGMSGASTQPGPSNAPGGVGQPPPPATRGSKSPKLENAVPPESGVFSGSRFEETEGDVPADGSPQIPASPPPASPPPTQRSSTRPQPVPSPPSSTHTPQPPPTQSQPSRPPQASPPAAAPTAPDGAPAAPPEPKP